MPVTYRWIYTVQSFASGPILAGASSLDAILLEDDKGTVSRFLSTGLKKRDYS
ncbi:hypothetical protein [Litoreibacter albidus]|uniref:hypothetical protein n=1 Tax=Litoreibacter albidus TaxID=670155 RepID=UPI00147E8295|nr:hypothetical protein [Litoreibacter albidus]